MKNSTSLRQEKNLCAKDPLPQGKGPARPKKPLAQGAPLPSPAGLKEKTKPLKTQSPIKAKGPIKKGSGPKAVVSRALGREAEEEAARVYYEVTGRQMRFQAASGARWHQPADLADLILVESKEIGTTSQERRRSVTIKKSWLEKLRHQAFGAGLGYCLYVRIAGDEGYGVTPAHLTGAEPCFEHDVFAPRGRRQVSFQRTFLDDYFAEHDALYFRFRGDDELFVMMPYADLLKAIIENTAGDPRLQSGEDVNNKAEER